MAPNINPVSANTSQIRRLFVECSTIQLIFEYIYEIRIDVNKNVIFPLEKVRAREYARSKITKILLQTCFLLLFRKRKTYNKILYIGKRILKKTWLYRRQYFKLHIGLCICCWSYKTSIQVQTLVISLLTKSLNPIFSCIHFFFFKYALH